MTVYLLGMQVLLRMVMGFVVGTFLVIGVSYRGTNWNNAMAMVTTIGTAAMAIKQCSFAWIAAQQVSTVIVFCLLATLDLHRKAPLLIPRLRYAQPRFAREILKQSGYFGLLFWSNFFVYQLPLILMQRMLGPSSVVAFSITRMIYSMSRQMLTAMTQTLGQEITELYGRHEWDRLFRLYELSERVVLAAIPAVSLGTLLATPVLISVWLHKPSLYAPYLCIVMAFISATMGIKEHKYQFQVSTNQHSMLARVTFWSYLVMSALAVPAIHMFGPMGFLVPWLITEVMQTIFILRLNQRLFINTSRLDFSPVYKLFALMCVAGAFGSWFGVRALDRSLPKTGAIALLSIVTLIGISYPLFHLSEVRIYLRERTASRSRKSA